MLKNILNLEGAQQLTKKEQKTINGGAVPCIVVTPTEVRGCQLPEICTKYGCKIP